MNKIISASEYKDNGQFLKGLLLTMALNKYLHQKQKNVVRKFAKEKDFESDFVESSINDLLKNPHLTKEVPKFESKEKAQEFFVAAKELIFSNLILLNKQKDWLGKVAQENDIEIKDLDNLLMTNPTEIETPA